ncbi:hypothetical protein QV06_06515 [Gallibacterium genomosp. 3]|uniref:Glycosyltransferase 2-like domain-containing protein n=1 Tax=Gallibacterium genomosp. 3 TaxID=505345 RepID=A0A1A7PRF7_9PAST|nr:glycosyltransferase family 2 protein [Gallibacterium genomosp. 3]OBX04307.1 hypothetical protein QV06_06515 [Gallibacterium genomosp. 3]
MKEQYTLSIIITVYNIFSFLEEAILSCFDDLSSVELIIVNDGSSEKMDFDSLLLKYSSVISIKYIKLKKNRGTFIARKVGVRASTGKYVVFLDADDYFIPGAILKIKDHLKESSYDLLLFQYKKNEEILPRFSVEDNILEMTNMTLVTYFNNYPDDFDWSSAGKVYRKGILLDVYSNLDFISQRLVIAEDLLLYSVASIYIKKFNFINYPLYYYRVHEDSITQQLDNNTSQLRMQQLDIIYQYLFFLKDRFYSSKENRFIFEYSLFLIIIERLALGYKYKKNIRYYMKYILAMYKKLGVKFLIKRLLRKILN